MSASFALLDGTLLPAEEARIPATCEGFLYGHGLFETIKVLSGRPVFLDRHHARLTAGTRALDLPYATGLDTLRDRLHRVIAANALTDGSVKVVVFAAGAQAGELVTARPGLYPESAYETGFRLRTRPDAGRSVHKTLNYLGNIRARRAAQAAGFDEALFLSRNGRLLEGSATNVFVVRAGVALTPPLSARILPGVARAQVLALLGPERAREAGLTRRDLDSADEIFVTNALLGVMPVGRVDGRTLAPGPFTRALRAAYQAHERTT